ncbi:hypothetical protein [Aeromonas jandaei]|uniref:hypothetical protein n=1 Tax=Aeromonas jandaei TaxID=650 RepID=UPI003EC905B7
MNKFNHSQAAKYLLHEIRQEKPQFDSIIDPGHIFSIQFVYPKLTHDRVKSQKGAFLLFGLNKDDASKPIELFKNDNIDKSISSPIETIHKIALNGNKIHKMKKQLLNLGIKKSFIYPEIDKVSEFLVKTMGK